MVGAGLVARCGPVDLPGPRASHRAPTPTSGGVAVFAAAAIGYAVALSGAKTTPDRPAATLVLTAACLFGALGAADDLFDVGAKAKLVASLLVAAGVAWALPPVADLPLGPGLNLALAAPLAVAGAVLWMVTATNAVNFMDGADGLAPGGMAIAFAALALGAAEVGQLAIAAAAAAAAAAGLGLLPWNLRRRVFQGDAGALFCGLLFAGLHLAAATRRHGPALSIYFGPLVLLPALTDVLLTLLRRARAGRPLLHAHREHLYQRWLDATGASHAALAARGWAAMTIAGAAALAMQAAPSGMRPLIFAGAVVVATGSWVWSSRRLGGATRRG